MKPEPMQPGLSPRSPPRAGDPAPPAPFNGSMAKTAARLALFGLGALALLPPLTWGLALALLGAPGADARAGGASVAAVGLGSAALAFALWAFVLRRPVRALQQAERRMRTFAKRDALTGLPNRDGLRLALERALVHWRGTRRSVGVLIIDVDRFRMINDSLGPAAGDQFLCSVAARIRAVVRDADVVARLGVDQFVVQVEGVSGLQALNVMARNLLRALAPAHTVGGRETVATASIGIALAGEQAEDPDSLLQCAEVAMRAAKGAGGARFRSYELAMQAGDEQRLDMERSLRAALRDSAFTLAFQPIMDETGQRVAAVEALMRWTDPVHGAVSPAHFIPLLEQTGMIVEAGTWVLRQACRHALGWRGRAGQPVLSVNVSPRQFAENRFVQTVQDVLAETGLPARRLQLEVTEGLLLDPSAETLRKIDQLAGLGVRLAVDDFGMGYSSLAYLKTFQLHTLKIDRMFVRDMTLSGRDAAIVRAIIDLGHGLGLHVTAEGVETAEQFEALYALGCDSLQGFFFARPVSADEVRALLTRPGAVVPDEGPVSEWSRTAAGLLGAA